MPALTRFRAQDGHIPGQLMREYYGQRASVPGTFIITESSLVSRAHDAMSPRSPMIQTKAQTAGWKAVVDEVHARGCSIFCQLIAVGRVTDPELARRDGLQIKAQNQGASAPAVRLGVVGRTPADLAEADAAVERQRRRVAFLDLKMHRPDAPLRQLPQVMGYH